MSSNPVFTGFARNLSFAAPKVDPYSTVQAELMFENSGVETARGISGQVYVKGVDAGDYFQVKDVDFYKGVGSMTVQVRTTSAAVLEVRKGSVDGKNVLYFVGAYGSGSIGSTIGYTFE